LSFVQDFIEATPMVRLFMVYTLIGTAVAVIVPGLLLKKSPGEPLDTALGVPFVVWCTSRRLAQHLWQGL